LIPILNPTATDAAYLRSAGIPTFGHSGLLVDIYDNRLHGKQDCHRGVRTTSWPRIRANVGLVVQALAGLAPSGYVEVEIP
jgi:hypothetical protein